MAKFNTQPSYKQPGPKSPMATAGAALTHEGGKGYRRDTKTELFLTAVTNMVGEDTFYEKAKKRDDRYAALVREVTLDDPAWMWRFLGWLRNSANMRSASVVAAAEAVLARREAKVSTVFALPSIGEMGSTRSFIPQAMARADEPGEFVAYWAQRTGSKTLPGGVQRGLGDAMVKLFDEYAYTKYGRPENGFQLADLVDLVHPGHTAPWQADLWQHALNERHERKAPIPKSLTMLAKRAEILAMPVEQRRQWLWTDGAQAELRAAGITFEQLSGWLGGELDAKFWESLIPSMGYMALLRNLRNFEKAGISRSARQQVQERLADPAQVARSRQFPYRFWSAYKAAQSDWWGEALSDALDASVGNLPQFPGRTLVLVDTSASMGNPVSAKSTVTHLEVGALFGVALARSGAQVDLHGFAGGHGGLWGGRAGDPVQFKHALPKGGSAMKAMQSFVARRGEVGHGTEITRAYRESYAGQERVVLVSDMQSFASYDGDLSSMVPSGVRVYGINTNGYSAGVLDLSKPNRYEVGGFSDQVFRMIALIEAGTADWPF